MSKAGPPACLPARAGKAVPDGCYAMGAESGGRQAGFAGAASYFGTDAIARREIATFEEIAMQARLNPTAAAPDAYKAVAALDRYSVKDSGLEPRLIHLIKLRASQINGCAYCVDMHVKEARRDGLGEQWINLVCAWRESPIYDARERAVLGWVEAVTNIAQTGAPDSAFQPLKEFFSDTEIVNITVAISSINVWNRLAVSFRIPHPIDAPVKAAGA
jgi:AhpD family alkylhydroperoxidase